MARRLVKLVAIGALTCAVGPVSVAYADPAPSWWEERSPEERRVIIDSFYTATGHAAPYLGEAAQGRSVVSFSQGGHAHARRPRRGYEPGACWHQGKPAAAAQELGP
jgi:hypothetical protein